MNQLPDENQKRFVAVISKKVEVGRAVNVLGHLSVSLANQLSDGDAVYTRLLRPRRQCSSKYLALSVYRLENGQLQQNQKASPRSTRERHPLLRFYSHHGRGRL